MFRAFCMVSGGSVKTDGCNGRELEREGGGRRERGERSRERGVIYLCVYFVTMITLATEGVVVLGIRNL